MKALESELIRGLTANTLQQTTKLWFCHFCKRQQWINWFGSLVVTQFFFFFFCFALPKKQQSSVCQMGLEFSTVVWAIHARKVQTYTNAATVSLKPRMNIALLSLSEFAGIISLTVFEHNFLRLSYLIIMAVRVMYRICMYKQKPT